MNKEAMLRQPTWKEWLILKRLAICKNLKPTYKKEWAERIGAKHYDPTFSRAINILIAYEIAETSPWVGNCSIVNINIKKLDAFIEKSDVYKEFKEYIYNKELVVVGV